MSVEIIQNRLLAYRCETVLEQENALKEIAQEIALMSLSRSGFFRVAAFQGGTCLRILYGLDRFSEYLDFLLAYSIQSQDLPSLFASKCHTLLCRKYTKGLDWYDFLWYVARKTPVNFFLLKSALDQAGPWVEKNQSFYCAS